MTRYAATTTVDSAASRAEIERTLERNGATAFMYGVRGGEAMVAFEIEGRRVQFRLPLPDREDFAFTDTGRTRTANSQAEAYEQAVRQRWRALLLCVKAKLESVAADIETFDDAFMAQLVLPGGETVGERMAGGLAEALRSGVLPPLLPAPRQVVGEVIDP